MNRRVEFDEATHTYRICGEVWPGVGEVMKAGSVQPDLTDFANWSALSSKAELGRKVHAACEGIDRGDRLTYEPEVEEFLPAYTKFLVDHKPVWRLIEKRLAHRRHRFCGTPDRVGWINGETVLDIKTGVNIYDHFGPAMAAYGMLARCRKPYRRIALQLKRDGTYKIIEFTNVDDESVFKAALKVYWWKRNNRERKKVAA